MSQEVLFHIDRKGTRIASYVPFRIVEISPMVIAGSGGAIPYNSLDAYSRQGTPDVRQGDLLTNAVSGEQYRASGTPSVKDMSFLKVQIERVMVKTP